MLSGEAPDRTQYCLVNLLAVHNLVLRTIASSLYIILSGEPSPYTILSGEQIDRIQFGMEN